MTKEQEIQALDNFICGFPPDSYLGAWLRESRLSIVTDIQSDFVPRPMFPANARAEAKDQFDVIIATAQKRADQIIDEANREASKAKTHAGDVRARAIQDLHRAIAAL